jgi:hypothetical protein
MPAEELPGQNPATAPENEANGLIAAVPPKALRLAIQPVQTALKCEFCVNFLGIAVLA